MVDNGTLVGGNAGGLTQDSALATSPATAIEGNALVSRLRVIEDQPLDSRAVSFVQLHDRLRLTLEGGDSPA